MEPALTTTGITGVIMIVICFSAWFFLSKSTRNGLNSAANSSISHCHFGVHGGNQCHVALPPPGLGRIVLQVRRVWRLAIQAVLFPVVVGGVRRVEGVLGLSSFVHHPLHSLRTTGHVTSVNLTPLYDKSTRPRSLISLIPQLSEKLASYILPMLPAFTLKTRKAIPIMAP